ncbi:MAG: cobalamin B12-binding domain-containing protein, partial [Firmicutes bacterium]|nr:cobalamin B12-binding domain-containing protein [Bacillota bacterium]
MKILLAAINAKYIHANLAVYSLRAYAERYKEQIQIKEYTINQYVDDILADIYREKADVIAFSCYIWNIGMVEELVSLLHQLRPELPIWLGGPEVSYDAAECMARNPGVTGIMRGEGEAIFREVAAYYADGSVDMSGIRGIIYRENDQLVDNGWREIMDINQVP